MSLSFSSVEYSLNYKKKYISVRFRLSAVFIVKYSDTCVSIIVRAILTQRLLIYYFTHFILKGEVALDFLNIRIVLNLKISTCEYDVPIVRIWPISAIILKRIAYNFISK